MAAVTALIAARAALRSVGSVAAAFLAPLHEAVLPMNHDPDLPQRPPISPAVTWLSGCTIALTVFGIAGTWLGYAALQAFLQELAQEERDKAAAIQATQEQADAAEQILEQVAIMLESRRVADREYPAALPERAPEDPWGNAVRYERMSPDRAVLTSAGRDGVFDTVDDHRLELP